VQHDNDTIGLYDIEFNVDSKAERVQFSLI